MIFNSSLIIHRFLLESPALPSIGTDCNTSIEEFCEMMVLPGRGWILSILASWSVSLSRIEPFKVLYGETVTACERNHKWRREPADKVMAPAKINFLEFILNHAQHRNSSFIRKNATCRNNTIISLELKISTLPIKET